MLSNQEDFDRDVRRVMQEVKGEEIPLDFLVDIEQRLDQMEKKKKRRMFLWFFMGIVLASGLSFGLLRENESSKTTVKNVEQNVTIQTSKPKALNQLASSKENVTIQTTKVESAAVISQPVVPRTMPSGRTEKATNPRFVRKNQTDVIPRIRPKENSATVPRQIATTKAPLNDQGISSNQKNEVSQVSETATSTPTRMDERSNPISVPVTTIPEIAPLINDVQANTNSTSINPVYPEPGILPIEKEKWVQTFGFFSGMSGIRSSVNVVDPSGVLWTNPPLVTEKYLAIRNAQERSTSSIDLSLRTSWMKHHFLIQTGVDYFEWGEQLK
ncbi:MAG: hypothetical protein ORN53_05305 [Crocinitomicaceae bacterium]|nr:hypothetical protein [Crocinitomicaceae bacterium]